MSEKLANDFSSLDAARKNPTGTITVLIWEIGLHPSRRNHGPDVVKQFLPNNISFYPIHPNTVLNKSFWYK